MSLYVKRVQTIIRHVLLIKNSCDCGKAGFCLFLCLTYCKAETDFLPQYLCLFSGQILYLNINQILFLLSINSIRIFFFLKKTSLCLSLHTSSKYILI